MPRMKNTRKTSVLEQSGAVTRRCPGSPAAFLWRPGGTLGDSAVQARELGRWGGRGRAPRGLAYRARRGAGACSVGRTEPVFRAEPFGRAFAVILARKTCVLCTRGPGSPGAAQVSFCSSPAFAWRGRGQCRGLCWPPDLRPGRRGAPIAGLSRLRSPGCLSSSNSRPGPRSGSLACGVRTPPPAPRTGGTGAPSAAARPRGALPACGAGPGPAGLPPALSEASCLPSACHTALGAGSTRSPGPRVSRACRGSSSGSPRTLALGWAAGAGKPPSRGPSGRGVCRSPALRSE